MFFFVDKTERCVWWYAYLFTSALCNLPSRILHHMCSLTLNLHRISDTNYHLRRYKISIFSQYYRKQLSMFLFLWIDLFFKSSISLTSVLYTFALTKPHRKKNQVGLSREIWAPMILDRPYQSIFHFFG